VRESFQEELKVTKLVADRALKSFGVIFRHAFWAPIPLVAGEAILQPCPADHPGQRP
jgi:hypothetical protein